MDPRFPPLAPQSPPSQAHATQATAAPPLSFLPLAEWLVICTFFLLLALV